MKAACHQLLALVGDRGLLVEQISKIDHRCPLARYEADIGQVLSQRYADVRIISRNLPLEWIDCKHGLSGSKSQHGRDPRAGVYEIGVHFCRDNVEASIAEEICRRRYASPIELLTLTKSVTHRTVHDLVDVTVINNTQTFRSS